MEFEEHHDPAGCDAPKEGFFHGHVGVLFELVEFEQQLVEPFIVAAAR